jgi:Dyp-type peroxidase family
MGSRNPVEGLTMSTPLLSQLDRSLAGADFKTYSTALAQLQGAIFKSHGRANAVHLFLTFHKGSSDQAKRFLSRLAPTLTSAAEQRRQLKGSSELFTALYLSARGYEHLGYSRGKFSIEFWNGMRAANLGDPPPEQWEPQYQSDIHAMVLLAHDNAAELESQLLQLRSQVQGFTENTSELGKRIGPSKNALEHFGYRDGISQPLFYESDVDGNTQNWDPRAGPNLVLIQDPYGLSADDCGTYLVFRKLEQNVRGFRQHTQELSATLQANGASAELAGAMVIGRFPDGTPVALHQQPLGKPENDFRYSSSDPSGNRCPFSAHVRKTNPRGGSGTPPAQERMHRIVRRGIPYGDPAPLNGDLSNLPETGIGLLFQCCQADLGEQFEFLQRMWASNANFPNLESGMDPLIGQPANGAVRRLDFPDPWGESSRATFSFHSFVSMKGGEYFFAPSISFLRSLA